MTTSAGVPDTTPAEADHQMADAAAAALHDLLSSFLRVAPRDMSLTSASVLSTLSRLGPRRITDLAASEGIAQPSVTALVASLVQAGYVERRSDPADKRVVMVAITDAGAAVVRTRRAARSQVLAAAIEKLSADEAATLASAIPVVERLHELIDEQRGLSQGA